MSLQLYAMELTYSETEDCLSDGIHAKGVIENNQFFLTVNTIRNIDTQE